MKINKSFFGLAIIALMVVGCSSSVNESEPGSNISSAVSSTTNNSATVVNSSSSTVSISSDKSSATEHQIGRASCRERVCEAV